MAETIYGYHGVILEVDLSAKKISRIPLAAKDARSFIGGRGLGMKPGVGMTRSTLAPGTVGRGGNDTPTAYAESDGASAQVGAVRRMPLENLLR